MLEIAGLSQERLRGECIHYQVIHFHVGDFHVVSLSMIARFPRRSTSTLGEPQR